MMLLKNILKFVMQKSNDMHEEKELTAAESSSQTQNPISKENSVKEKSDATVDACDQKQMSEKATGADANDEKKAETQAKEEKTEPTNVKKERINPLEQLTRSAKRLVASKACQGMNKGWSKLSRIQKELMGFVVVPTLIVFLYLLLWASPMYISETKFAVQTTQENMGMDITSQVLKMPGTASKEAQIVDAFIHSTDAFKEMNDQLGLIDHYSGWRHDWVSRMPFSPTSYEQDQYWGRIINTIVDLDSGIVTFKVRAYTPEMAQRISSGILKLSETLINQMNERSHRDTLHLAEDEVKRAQQKLNLARNKVKEFRHANNELDPVATAGGLHEILMKLEAQKAQLQSEITEARSFMHENAPALKNLQSKLTAVQAQLAQQKQIMTGQQGNQDTINTVVSAYQTLLLEEEFAQKQVVSALAAMESARINTLSQNKYVVTIEKPTLPDESRYPLIFQVTLSVLAGLLLLFGLGRLVILSIKEHSGF